jgi:serine/threonine protein kinase
MAIGHVLGGRYRADELLASGGMAAVWRGWDLRLDRPVAIKRLAGAGLGEPMATERFHREARTVARLAHPNIVTVYDFGTEDGDQYLIMELVEGTTVAAMLADGPLPVDQAVAISAQTCDGLAAAHAAGVVHRDIKPANLILTPAGVVKICDFGIARLTAGHTTLTGTATALGSSKYMAPEQANGEPVDARADLYALGCTLYIMLAGEPPFSGDSVVSIVHQHATRQPTPVRERRPDAPAALEALVGHLLAKSPADRPAGAAEVGRRLVALLDDRASTPGGSAAPSAAVPTAAAFGRAPAPVAPGIPSSSNRGDATSNGGARTPASRRNRWLIGIGGLAVLIAAAAIALLLATQPRPTGQQAGAGPSEATSGPVSVGSPSPEGSPPTPSVNPSPVARSSGRVQSTSAPSPAPTRTVAPTRTQPSTPPADPIVAMRLSIQEQVATGNLNPDVARDLYRAVDEVAAEINEGDTSDAAKKVDELHDLLATLLKEGRLTRAGYDALSRDADRLGAGLS